VHWQTPLPCRVSNAAPGQPSGDDPRWSDKGDHRDPSRLSNERDDRILLEAAFSCRVEQVIVEQQAIGDAVSSLSQPSAYVISARASPARQVSREMGRPARRQVTALQTTDQDRFSDPGRACNDQEMADSAD
jgi:hypothetical protein